MHCNHNYKNLKIRRGNAQRFNATNPVLQSGEIAYGNVPGMKFHIVKIGDGVTPWKNLPCLPFNDPVPYTTSPPVCVDDNFLSLRGGYFDLSFRGTPVGNNGSLENPNYKIPPSSYQFDYDGLTQNSPFVLANYGSKINSLGEDDFSVNFSFYLTNKNGRHSQYGETFPLFTIGDNFNTNSLGEGELSVNLLKTGDNDSSINVTSFSFQSDSLKESGISTEILPSAWYDFTLERANNLFTIKIENDTLVSHSHAMSGIELGKDLSNNNFLIGNAYPSGNFNPQFSGILIDNFQVTKTCPREYYCVQEVPTPKEYYCVQELPPPTTTPSPEGCGFVSIGSLFMGVSLDSDEILPAMKNVVQTPDTCSLWPSCSIYGCNCNEPHDSSTWKFTSPTTMTFNGSHSYVSISPLIPNDLGSTILISMDSMFIAAGSSFHIFDHNNVEIIRYVGPLLLVRNELRNGYTDNNGNFFDMYNGLDVQAALATMPSSLGGNWGDHITNDRVFDEMETPPAGSFNNATIFSNGQKPKILEWQKIAIGRGVHRFEIRTPSCPTTTTTTSTTTTTTSTTTTTTSTTTPAPLTVNGNVTTQSGDTIVTQGGDNLVH